MSKHIGAQMLEFTQKGTKEDILLLSKGWKIYLLRSNGYFIYMVLTGMWSGDSMPTKNLNFFL